MTEPISLKSSSYKSQSTKPEKYEMMKLFSPISAKWHQIGDLLKVDSNTMEGLRNSTFADEVKLSIMLQKWLEKSESTSVTWDEIIRVKSEVTSKPPSMYFDLYHVSIANVHIYCKLHYLQRYAFPYSEMEFSVLVPCRHLFVIMKIVCDVILLLYANNIIH